MTVKLTAKQEKFAQVWHATGNKSEAYRQAYNCGEMSDTTIARKAVDVAENGNVRAMYEQLQTESAERNKRTVDSLDRMYQEAFEVARDSATPAAMVSAVNGLAKLHGLNAPDKVNNTVSFLESDYLNEVQKNLK